ncbi:arsenate reductase family protein [Paenibacillus sp. JCM 10914]|uniref:arsenate reductase family protein n=1 Tax=Paenibacillus sp. JCM 10914 TaxID=1236974 RepID=UPI0003CC9901|nr:arsenate reductase family protein [Paenibacillus sp. JCM 10914]GAE05703.1 arsenate reductase [Paenibacillus sp. JCM 10914]
MHQLKVYQYPKCGTCRNAVKWLQNEGYELSLQNIFEQAPTTDELEDLIAKSGLELKKFFNTSGEVYKEMNLKDKLAGLTDKEKIELLSSNGRLIKRPIVTDGSQVTVGFKAEQYQASWGK